MQIFATNVCLSEKSFLTLWRKGKTNYNMTLCEQTMMLMVRRMRTMRCRVVTLGR